MYSESNEIIAMLRIGMEAQYYLLKGSVKAVLKMLQLLGRLKEKGVISGKKYEKFGKFINATKGDYKIINLPTQDNREVIKVCEDMNRMGVTYYVLPDLNSSDGLTQIAYYSPHAEKMENIVQNFCMNRLQGGEKDFGKLQKLTQGQVAITSIPWDKELSLLTSDFDKLGIDYAVLPDLNVGDGMIQIAYADKDAGKMKGWFELYQEDLVKEGKETREFKEMSMEEYMDTGKLTGNEYENTASGEIKEQLKDFGKNHEKQDFEKALDASQNKIRSMQDEKYMRMKEQPGLKEVTINVESLVRDENNTQGIVMVRLPGTYNGNGMAEIDISVSVNEVFAADDGKTYVTFLDASKMYDTFSYNPDGKVSFKIRPEKMTGQEIGEYFDKVQRNLGDVKSLEQKLSQKSLESGAEVLKAKTIPAPKIGR